MKKLNPRCGSTELDTIKSLFQNKTEEIQEIFIKAYEEFGNIISTKIKEGAFDGCIRRLANAFSMDIIYYNDDDKNSFKNEGRVFTAPLVIRKENEDIYIMYTKGQARLFAGSDSVKNLFPKTPRMVKKKVNCEDLTSYKKEIENTLQELNKVKDEKKQLEIEVKSRRSTMDLLIETLLEFAEKVLNHNRAIKNYTNLGALSRTRRELVESMFFTGGLEDQELLKNSYPESIERISYLQNMLKKEDPSKVLEKLNKE